MYRYNLNDFTGVKEDVLQAGVSVRLVESGLVVDHEFFEGGSLELYDVTGCRLLSTPLGASPYRATLPESIRGILAVVIRGADGSTARTVILR